MPSIREQIIAAVYPKESKLLEGNAAIIENMNCILVRDNELLEIHSILTGLDYSGLFYNVDAHIYIKWDVGIDGFVKLNGDIYGAVIYLADFESGSLPSGWAFVNGGENDWIVGTAAKSSGTYGLYISNDGGATNAYSSVGAGLDVSHVYFDVDLPGSVSSNFLVLDWRCEAEIGYDYAQVFSCPTTFTPTANVEVVDGVDGDLIGSVEYNDQSQFANETIELPSAIMGTTRRFIFSWRNDTSVQNQPPMAIDNVKIVYR